MNRTDRLYALVEELRAVAPRPRSARWLAQRFEVSARTVERDLSALQQSGVPIYPVAGRSGGYALDRERTLPPLAITPDEATALAIGLRSLTGTPFASAARTALQKVRAVMPAGDLESAHALADRIVFVASQKPPAAPAPVHEALASRRLLRLRYADRNGVDSQRLVEPLGFLGSDPHWYLLAWCRLREAVRGFRLDRIRAAEMLDEQVRDREVNLLEMSALGHQLVGMEVTVNTDRTVSPKR
ncbi:YafY family protein [Fodinicola feengrottensis]|uniref:YafY family protein n=1 Tax=Fodinicola feengrottensis TaxID=435914 RepID=A0ABN2GCB5_9ACTN